MCPGVLQLRISGSPEKISTAPWNVRCKLSLKCDNMHIEARRNRKLIIQFTDTGNMIQYRSHANGYLSAMCDSFPVVCSLYI